MSSDRSTRNSQSRPAADNAGFVLGRARFAHISAVEGIELSPDMRSALEDFDRRKLAAAERRRAIIGRFTPKA